MRVQVDLLPRGEERVPVQEAMALQADNNTLALAVQDLRATLAAQQKGIDNMNWQLEQKTKQVRHRILLLWCYALYVPLTHRRMPAEHTRLSA